MTQHKENVLPQPASPAAFYCTFLLYKKKIKKAKNKKKLKKNLKIQHIKRRTKKGAKKRAKKEPNRGEEGRLESKERRGEKNERYTE